MIANVFLGIIHFIFPGAMIHVGLFFYSKGRFAYQALLSKSWAPLWCSACFIHVGLIISMKSISIKTIWASFGLGTCGSIISENPWAPVAFCGIIVP